MTTRWLCLLAVLAAVLVAGCGGGGSNPVVIAGNYFPLAIGTVWQYTTELTAETPSEKFETTGTMTRTLVGTQNITVSGEVISAYVFQHDYTAVDTTPDLTGPSSGVVSPYINYLFSPTGGLASIRAYYRVVAATADMPAHVELVAMSKAGGPIVPVSDPQPYLFTPPYQGTMENTSLWFMPMPLAPFPTDLSSMEAHGKVLNYGVLSEVGGAANTIISINYFQGNLHQPGLMAAFGGRARTFLKDGVGLFGTSAERSDWYATINVGGATSQVTSDVNLISMVP